MSMKELCLAILRTVAVHEVTVTTRQGDGTIERQRVEKHATTEARIHEEFLIKYPMKDIETALRLLNMKGYLVKNFMGLMAPFYYSLTESGRRIVATGEFEATQERMLSAIPIAGYPSASTDLSDLQTAIEKGFADTSEGLIAIQAQLSQLENEALKRILGAVEQGRIEQGEIFRTLDAIRRALRFLQQNNAKLDDETRNLTTTTNDAIESNISLRQKLELALPIIPFLLSHKIELELDANTQLDLNSLLEEIKQRWAVLNRSAEKLE